MCQKCEKREATENWSAGGVMDYIHGFSQKWCKPCVLEEQLKFCREQAARIPGLERELADLLGYENAPMYTVFEPTGQGPGPDPAVAGWELFSVYGDSGLDEVRQEVEQRGFELLIDEDSVMVDPERVDEYQILGSDYDSYDLARAAGIRLLKLPDGPESRYFRLAVISPLPDWVKKIYQPEEKQNDHPEGSGDSQP